jgi:hypothetical protein
MSSKVILNFKASAATACRLGGRVGGVGCLNIPEYVIFECTCGQLKPDVSLPSPIIQRYFMSSNLSRIHITCFIEPYPVQ